MNCPHAIFPHQIQGLDYEKILPVIKYFRMVSYQKLKMVSYEII